MKHILKCAKCGAYSIKKVCSCGGACIIVKPAKFSIEDRYAAYRRKAKEYELREKGLI